MPSLNINITDGRAALVAVVAVCVTMLAVTLIKCWSTPRNVKRINEKLDRDKVRLDTLERRMVDMQQSQRRNELFRRPTSKQMHGHLLEEGRLYLADGGNGEGHARYESLLEDWVRRDRENDWDYRKD
jgi:hypothetical protein